MVLFWDFIALPRAYMESLRQGEQLIGYRTEQVSITLISQTNMSRRSSGGGVAACRRSSTACCELSLTSRPVWTNATLHFWEVYPLVCFCNTHFSHKRLKCTNSPRSQHAWNHSCFIPGEVFSLCSKHKSWTEFVFMHLSFRDSPFQLRFSINKRLMLSFR